MKKEQYKYITFISIIFAIAAIIISDHILATSGYTVDFPASDFDLKKEWQDLNKYSNDSNAILLLGTSRIMSGVDQNILEDELGGPVISLGITGPHCMRFLEFVATETNFSGKVIVEVVPVLCSHQFDNSTSSYIDTMKTNASWSESCDNYLYSKVSQSSIVCSPRVSIFNLEQVLVHKEGLKPIMFTSFDQNRQIYYDFSTLEKVTPIVKPVYYTSKLKVLDPDQWMNYMISQDKYADMIEQRGGKVYYLRFPTSGLLEDFENKVLPDKESWDRFVQYTDSKTIQSKDFDNNYICPDDWHLDSHQAKSFTLDLIKVMKE